MGSKDIKLLTLTLIPVLVLVILAALAPVYHMPSGHYERHWVWNAPTIIVRHGYDDLTPEEIARLNAVPQQKQILDGMKALPREVPISPIYVGGRRHGQNLLGYTAMVSMLLWGLLFWYKWFNR